MGTRQDTWAGLSPQAEKMLDNFQINYTRVCHTYWEANDRDQQRKVVTDTIAGRDFPPEVGPELLVDVEGMFGEPCGSLHRYWVGKGSRDYWDEAIQAEPWSSGPIYFLALKDADGLWIQSCLWREDQMNEWI